MKLALAELRRRPGRFSTAGVILFLIATLLMVLGALSEGLNGGNDGAIRAQQAELVVFSATADRSVPQSVVDASTRDAIGSVDDVAATGAMRLTQLSARLTDDDTRDLIDVAVFGVDLAVREVDPGIPAGTAWADRRLADRGVEAGSTLFLGPARTPVTITGFLDDTAYVAQGTVWIGTPAFDELVTDNKPDEVLAPGDQQVVWVQLAPGADPATVAAAIDAATGTTETVTRAAAAAAIPPVDGGVLQQIIVITAVIAAAVVALFFALLTSERLGLYGVLKAIGAKDRTLMAGVVAQAVTLTAVGLALAIPIALLLDAVLPPESIPFALGTGRIVTSAALLLGAAVIGALLTLRRVLRIEPASVIGTAL